MNSATPHTDTQFGHLERWKLPFANSLHPSVSLIIPPNSVDRLIVVVMPQGLEEYPGYILDFKRAHFTIAYDESCAKPTDPYWFEQQKQAGNSCAYIWHNSPLVRLQSGIGCPQSNDITKLKHYLLLGGDSIVEVLAYEEPQLKQFNKPERLIMEYTF